MDKATAIQIAVQEMHDRMYWQSIIQIVTMLITFAGVVFAGVMTYLHARLKAQTEHVVEKVDQAAVSRIVVKQQAAKDTQEIKAAVKENTEITASIAEKTTLSPVPVQIVASSEHPVPVAVVPESPPVPPFR